MKASSGLYRYGFMAVLSIAGILVGWATGAWASSLLLSIIISSAYLDSSPNLILIVVSVFAYDFFFLPPTLHVLHSPAGVLRLSVFAISALAVRHLIQSRRDVDQQYGLVVDTVPVAIISADDSGTITDANPTTRLTFGYELSELIGTPLRSILPDFELKSIGFGEASALRKGGARFPAELGFRFMTSGRRKKWIGFVRDVTEQRRTRDELQASKQEFRRIIDTVPAMIWSASTEGQPLFINRRLEAYAGEAAVRAFENGQNLSLEGPHAQYAAQWIALIHPEDFDANFALWKRCLETGASYEVEYRMRRFDGEFRWFQVRAEPMRDENNGILSWLGVNLDIDDSKRTKLQLQATQSTLARATQSAAIAELSASIAHELNQPLTAVIANSEACIHWLSAKDPNIERAMFSVEGIAHDGKTAAEIVRRIKSLFQKAPLVKNPVGLNEIIIEVLHLISIKILQGQISVRTELAENLPPVMADRLQIQQVLVNLIQNGVEAMQDRMSRSNLLVVRSRIEHGSALVEVEDHGCGIDDVGRIFETFFTTKKQGLGMGLSISHSIIEAHGGRLWAESEPNHGSVLRFTLSLSPTAAGVDAPKSDALASQDPI